MANVQTLNTIPDFDRFIMENPKVIVGASVMEAQLFDLSANFAGPVAFAQINFDAQDVAARAGITTPTEFVAYYGGNEFQRADPNSVYPITEALMQQ